MATIGKLIDKHVRDAKQPCYLGDGGGLWLQVAPRKPPKNAHEVDGWAPVTKSWLFRYTSPVTQKAREMGLGPYPDITLKAAREKATVCRQLLIEKRDPLIVRDEALASNRNTLARRRTFDQCAADCLAAIRHEFKSAKHLEQWTNSLGTYASPVIGSMYIDEIESADVVRVLQPIWTQKPETAGRVRGRMERVFGWAIAAKLRSDSNPARFKDNLEPLLGKLKKRKRNYAALPFDQLGEFIAELRTQAGMAARALEFTILTAIRTGPIMLARWDEFNFDKATWDIPASHMKTSSGFSIPLSPAALSLARGLHKQCVSDVVFPVDGGKPMSDAAMMAVIKRMNKKRAAAGLAPWTDPKQKRVITVHGFRSTFKDWCSECTSYSRDVSEMALAHVVGNKVEAAYRRGDLFEKRRQLMNAWAKYCNTQSDKSAKIHNIRGGRA